MKVLNNKIKKEIRDYRESLRVDKNDPWSDPFGQFEEMTKEPYLLQNIARKVIAYHKYWERK